MPKKKTSPESKALKVFREHGGVLRATDAFELGVHPRTLYTLRDEGSLEQVQRGLYCLPNLPGQEQPDLALVARLVPQGVVCLLSALYLHQLTTQIPHFINITVPQGYKPPKVDFLPVQFYWLSPSTFEAGVELHHFDGVEVKCYSEEKTIVDCFKFRNKVGIDVAIEALKKYWNKKNPKLNLILKYAKISRVEKVMKPYLESVIHES